MSQNTSVTYNIGGWFGLLGIIFVLAKIFAIGPVADWSWWLVLLPFYLGFAILLTIFGGAAIIAGLVFAVAVLIDWYEQRKRIQRRREYEAREKARRESLTKKD